MPRGDGTGPTGWGLMTGRAAGYCAGYAVPGYLNPVPGRGPWGRGGAGGRGWRHRNYAAGVPGWMRGGWGGWAPAAPPVPEAEERLLQGQVEILQRRLEEMRQRLEELSAAKGGSPAPGDRQGE